MMTNCKHCNTPLVDGNIDWYCPNKMCDGTIIEARTIFKQLTEQRERKELARLKAKYETVHRST
jgi:uncharacterized Zn finger protein (UPF0148 family)